MLLLVLDYRQIDEQEDGHEERRKTRTAGSDGESGGYQQGSGSGSYTVGNNGVPGDSGVGTLFGSSGRNILLGPAESRFDLALTKIFPIHEAVNLKFRAEAFKVFNNPIFSNPQSNISNSTFGRITSTIDGTGRILQLALKLNF